MEFLRRAIEQIKTQLGSLSVSGRLVIILLLVIMAGAIFWMVDYAAQKETVPLMNQAFTEDEIARISTQLDLWEEDYSIKGDRIYVPKDRQMKLIYRLGAQSLLPKDTSIGWASLLEDTDIWTPESHRQDKKKIILQLMLARALVEGWPEIDKAQVFINQAGQRRLNNITPVSSASVSVQLSPTGRPTRQLARSIAEFISAANSRMKRENVKVIVDGSSVPVFAEGEEFSSDYLNEKVKYEDLYVKKIHKALPVVNALVQVDVVPRMTRTTRHESKIAPADQGSLVAEIEKTSREHTSTATQPEQEPGMMANLTADQSSAGPTQQETTEESTTASQVIPGSTDTTEIIGPGGIEKLTATVSVPLAYFETLAKRESGSEDEPAPDFVRTITERELPRLKQIVMRSIGLVGKESEQNVVVDTFWAGGIAAEKNGMIDEELPPESASASIAGIASRYGKHIVVSALALASLFMVLMMVRKATGPIEIEQDEAAVHIGKKPLDALSLEESNIDDGDEVSGLLAGMEIGEDDIQTQQVLEQIRSMVQESPDVAANLVNKWLEEDS